MIEFTTTKSPDNTVIIRYYDSFGERQKYHNNRLSEYCASNLGITWPQSEKTRVFIVCIQQGGISYDSDDSDNNPLVSKKRGPKRKSRAHVDFETDVKKEGDDEEDPDFKIQGTVPIG